MQLNKRPVPGGIHPKLNGVLANAVSQYVAGLYNLNVHMNFALHDARKAIICHTFQERDAESIIYYLRRLQIKTINRKIATI